MPHSFCKICVHAIWSTKNRAPFINEKAESKIYDYMKEEFTSLGCPVLIINGMPDHVHCLFFLNYEISIAGTIKQIKGSSSHFINQNDIILDKFSWQTGYAAFSVSESMIKRVFNYIKNQKQHHKEKGFEEEYESYKKVHGFTNE